MKLIFIGSLYNDDDLIKLTNLGSRIDYAAHRFQTALLTGLSQYYDDITVITAPNITPFPRIRNIYIGKKEIKISRSVSLITSGYINIPFIKLISKFLRIRKLLIQNIDKKKEYTLIIYGAHSPFLLASFYLYNKRNVKSCLVIPDLPEFMSDKGNKFHLFAKKIDKKLINICIRNIDSFVLLSKFMKLKLPIGNKPHIQIEGIYDPEAVKIVCQKEKCKTLLYTGSLDKRYGIVDLLDAFSLINSKEYQLWICGAGDSSSLILEYQSKDPRIQYFGVLSKDDVYLLQRKATLLVNPRHSTEEYTKYSFPSKTMEYLASGTPTLMSHLVSIPKEYDDYIFYFDNESVTGMKDKILEVCEKEQTELNEFGEKAARFILQNKSSIVQAKKIVDLVFKIK